MSVPDYQKKATKKWKSANYDKICVEYPKGTRDAWKDEAKKRGLSLAQLIFFAVNEYIKGA